MTPQSNFMVAAPIAPGQEAGLRAVLATMNSSPGVVDPNNPLVPFARFDRLHVARFVILNDETLGDDLRQYGETLVNLPVWLVFLGDCDGPAETMLAEFVAQAGTGLAMIFEHCEGFDRHGDLLAWMQAHSANPAAQYVNWVGRTVRANSRGGGVARRVVRTAARGFRESRRLKSTGGWLLPCDSLAQHSLHRRQRPCPGSRTGSATSSACRSH